jgi:hypothetical protein
MSLKETKELDKTESDNLFKTQSLVLAGMLTVTEAKQLTCTEVYNLSETKALILAKVLTVSEAKKLDLKSYLTHTNTLFAYYNSITRNTALIIAGKLTIDEAKKLTPEECHKLQVTTPLILADKLTVAAVKIMHYKYANQLAERGIIPLILARKLTVSKAMHMNKSTISHVVALSSLILADKLTIDEAEGLTDTWYDVYALESFVEAGVLSVNIAKKIEHMHGICNALFFKALTPLIAHGLLPLRELHLITPHQYANLAALAKIVVSKTSPPVSLEDVALAKRAAELQQHYENIPSYRVEGCTLSVKCRAQLLSLIRVIEWKKEDYSDISSEAASKVDAQLSFLMELNAEVMNPVWNIRGVTFPGRWGKVPDGVEKIRKKIEYLADAFLKGPVSPELVDEIFTQIHTVLKTKQRPSPWFINRHEYTTELYTNYFYKAKEIINNTNGSCSDFSIANSPK